MSDFGVFLMMFAGLLLLLGLIRFLAWLTSVQEEHGSLARAGVHTIQRYVDVRHVKPFQDAAPVMSRDHAQTQQTDQTDGQTDLVSEADRWLDRIEIDRTREAVVELLVYSGWSVSDMRKANILRGDNGAIGVEVEAARQRLGITAEPRQLRVKDDHGERLISMDV